MLEAEPLRAVPGRMIHEPEHEMVVLAGVWLAIILWCAAIWLAVALLLDRVL